MRPAALAALLLLAAPVDEGRFVAIDAAVNGAIQEGLLPGAVVLVGQGERDVYLKAFGDRAVVPRREPMTPDTIFDAASLTKVVATTTSVMILVQEGRIRLADRVSTFIPGFEKHGKEEVTIRHLLTHVSGLRPDLDLDKPFDGGHTRAIELAIEERLEAPPGERFIYSDINFFLLGDIVARVSGDPLDVFARTRIFEPLGMRDTGFRPADALRPRIAPTEACEPLAWPCGTPGAPMLRGVVHDPTARRMGGAAGHAGLFTTAADLARFCRMLLNGGELDGVRILAPLTVAAMTRPSSPPGHRDVRGLGWDIDSRYSSNRGDLFGAGAFGHTGFTGTSIWIDPASRMFVVFLSNRVHPDGKGDVTPLRGRVATIAASAYLPAAAAGGTAAPGPRGDVLAGIDVLRAEAFARLEGKRVGLVTNAAARTRDGGTTLDALAAAKGVTLAALFSPEHGISVTLDDEFGSSRDATTGLQVHSLYGGTRRPDPSTLEGLDAIVIDLPDIGARFYTYMTTLALMMEEAAKKKLPVVVLDRPNPIGGVRVEGPLLDKGLEHFAGYYTMPVRHGLTLGELARLFNGEKRMGAGLTVVEARGWTRDRWFDETGLVWANPSPNMRNLHQAALYPGIGAIEWSNVSVGRGTDAPFEQLGAPWVDGVALAAALNARGIAGVRFYPVSFTPSSSVYEREECHGVFMVVTDRDALRPVRLGVEVASALYRLHPKQYDFKNTVRLLGSQDTIDRIRRGDDPAHIAASWADDESAWRQVREKYLLYR